MDQRTSIHELKEKVKRFCEERDWDKYHAPKELATGLIIEAAELLEHFRWKSGEDSKSLLDDAKKRKEIEDELADILYFVLRLSQKYNIDLTTSLYRKMEENAKKYPVEKSRGSKKKYDEL